MSLHRAASSAAHRCAARGLRAVRVALRRVRSTRGSGLVEFIVLTFVLTVPLLYLVGTMSRLQAASYAVTAAARESGRTFVTSPDGTDREGRARMSFEMALADHGFSGQGRSGLECSASPCMTPEASVRTTAAIDVKLPLIPNFVEGVVPTSITVESSHEERVERFRDAP